MSIPSKANRAILLLGMHRSGTSATMRVINLLGAQLGSELLAPAGDNPSGFWEHRGVVAIHEELLGALDRSWQDVRAMPDDWLSSEAAAIARKKLYDLLSQEFSSSPLWAVKDPRLSRLLPLWLQVLGDMNVEACVVFVVRNPAEVAQSLAARDGLSSELTHLSWLQYILEGELAARHLARAVITYDNLLHDWAGCMRQLEHELHLQWPVAIEEISNEVAAFINVSERHHKADKADEAELPELARSVYQAFLEKANGYASWDRIEKISDVYQRSAEVFLDGINATVSQLVALKVTEAQKSLQLEQLEHRVDGLQVALNEMAAQSFMRVGPLQGGQFKDVAKVYFRHASGIYSEQDSAQFLHEGLHDTTRILWTLQAPAGFDFIRFDPSEFPGEFLLQDLQINGIKIECNENSFTAVHQFIVRDGSGGFRFAASDSDPFVELDARSLTIQYDAAVVVELTCQRLTPGGELRQLIEAALQATSNNHAAKQTELLRLQQATHNRFDSLEERLTLSDANHTNALTRVTDRVEHFVAQQNTIADHYAAAAASREQATRDELRAHQQASAARLDALDAHLGERETNTQHTLVQLIDRLEHFVAQHNTIADHYAAAAASREQAIRDELRSYEQATYSRLEAMEMRLAEISQALASQLIAVQGEQASQQGGIRDSLASLAEAARQSSQEHAEEISHLRQQTSDIIRAQRSMDISLGDLGSKLETQAILGGVTARQVREISSQQDVTLSNLDAIANLLRELSDVQRRSFLTRLQMGISRKRSSGA